MDRRIAVRGIFVIDGKLLCVKLKPYKEASKGDYWCVPGGGIDSREALIPALEREIMEELGVKPLVGNLIYIQQYLHKNTDCLEFFFHILNPHDYLNVDLQKTSHGTAEIQVIDFIDPKGHDVKPHFLTTENFDQLEDQVVKIFSYPQD